MSQLLPKNVRDFYEDNPYANMKNWKRDPQAENFAAARRRLADESRDRKNMQLRMDKIHRERMDKIHRETIDKIHREIYRDLASFLKGLNDEQKKEFVKDVMKEAKGLGVSKSEIEKSFLNDSEDSDSDSEDSEDSDSEDSDVYF